MGAWVQTASFEKTLAFDIRSGWQSRALVETKGQHTGMVLLSILAHSYDEAMPALLMISFPGFIEPPLPCIMSAAKVSKSGTVVADVVDRGGFKIRNAVIYHSELRLRDDFRRLADRLKLNDSERTEMFKCVQRWVVADRRLDPTFDPRDPDAKRLIH